MQYLNHVVTHLGGNHFPAQHVTFHWQDYSCVCRAPIAHCYFVESVQFALARQIQIFSVLFVESPQPLDHYFWDLQATVQWLN